MTWLRVSLELQQYRYLFSFGFFFFKKRPTAMIREFYEFSLCIAEKHQECTKINVFYK